MGSLMAGWDSPVLADVNKVRVVRNRSLTKEDVDAFWREHGRKPADGGGEVGSPGATVASPLGRRGVETDPDAGGGGGGGESPSKSRDWWTRSNWAFLNEPPREEAPGKAHSYTPQFDVAATGHA